MWCFETDQILVRQPKIGQERSGFSFKDYCFDNLIKYNISAFLEHLRTFIFDTPAVVLLVYSDFHNKNR